MTTDITPESLIAELRPTMPEEVRRAWAIDAATALADAQTRGVIHDAEVARQTAERAWDECSSAWANRQIVAEAIISRAAECVREAYPRDQVATVLSNTLPQRPVNPYRAEQIGEEH